MGERPSLPLPEGPRPAPSTAPAVNMSDVAAQAGVSIATVSRALRDVGGVSAGTRDRVRRIARELAYVVSPEASGLARRETGRVAVVLPRLDVWFYAAMLARIEEVLRGAHLDVLLYQVDGEVQRRRFFQELPARRKVDAMVLLALPLLREEERRLDLLGVEVVVAGGRLRDYPHVDVDDALATRLAVDHLVGLGHRRIAMIRTSDTDGAVWSSDVARSLAFLEALAGHGLAPRPTQVVTRPFSPDAGRSAMHALLDSAQRPTAVFAYSDELAVGAMAAARERGVRIPEDLSLIGVDGHPLTAVLDLSTVDQQVGRQGERVGSMVLDRLRGSGQGSRSVRFDPILVPRGSTGPAPD